MVRAVGALLLASLLVLTSGCATIFRGDTQEVTIRTYPAGGTVVFDGREVSDGERITVHKRFDAPRFFPDDDPRYEQTLSFGPDPWLIGDAALLIFYVIPGLVALGIDFATGAWRQLDSPQVIHLPASED